MSKKADENRLVKDEHEMRWHQFDRLCAIRGIMIDRSCEFWDMAGDSFGRASDCIDDRKISGRRTMVLSMNYSKYRLSVESYLTRGQGSVMDKHAVGSTIDASTRRSQSRQFGLVLSRFIRTGVSDCSKIIFVDLRSLPINGRLTNSFTMSVIFLNDHFLNIVLQRYR